MNKKDDEKHLANIKNKTISFFMDTECMTLNLNDTIDKAIGILLKFTATNLPVIDNVGNIKGSITYPLIVDFLLNGQDLSTQVEQVMREECLFYNENESIHHYNFNLSYATPVVNDTGKIVGTLHPEKVIKKLLQVTDNIQLLEQVIELYEFCFDTAYEGVTVVDADGYIRLFNEAYSRYTRTNKEEAIGKHCSEVIENSRLPVVLETGIPERNQPHILQGQSMIVHRLPIWKGNTIIGAVGMLIFEGVSELSDTFNRAQKFFNNEHTERYVIKSPEKRDRHTTFDQIIGESMSLGKAKKIARKAAKTMATILLTGESGVGKELFASSIHSASPVSSGPLIAINCAAIPGDLLESELFGYDEGAFTGAKKGGKPGKFELAHGGTLFLDEIGEMSLDLQTKLLRVLQEQRFERVGGSREIQVNVRIVAATNKSLENQIKKGKFRADLFYRINVIPVLIPALRDRRKDIPHLVSIMLEEVCSRYNLDQIELSKDSMKALLDYDWPGNVRELANVIERVVVLAESKRIELRDLPTNIVEFNNHVKLKEDYDVQEEENFISSEEDMLIKVLKEVAGNKSRAARKLGIHRSTLYKKLKKYKLNE